VRHHQRVGLQQSGQEDGGREQAGNLVEGGFVETWSFPALEQPGITG